MKGHTLVELLIVIGIFTILFTFSSLNLLGARSKTSLGTSVDVLLSDLRAQQIKAMSGDTGGSAGNINYGIHFLSNSYILFKNIYSSSDPSNFTVDLDDITIITPVCTDVVFAKGSGEVAPAPCSIKLTSTSSNSELVIVINRFGVITSVN